MEHFLLIYSHKDQALLESPRVFAEDDVEAATAAYQDAEAAHNGSIDIEIVLVGADSIETIRRTHGHYFEATTDRLARYLASA